jgi:hypothetical protein
MIVELRLSHQMTIGSFGMVEESQSWTRIIDVAVTKANVGYIAEGADPDAHGVAEISGNASLLRLSDAEPSKFQISLSILGKSASQAKSEADQDKRPWPDVMNEITDNDDVIGILFKAEVDEFELRRGYLYLHPAQFDKLIGNLATSMEIRFHSRQGVQSECDLIVRVAVWTKTIAPQS